MSDLKTKLMPPKLNFVKYKLKTTGGEYVNGFNRALEEDQTVFDAWYAQHVAPLFENAVEVYGYTDYDGDLSFSDREANADTHRALLIGVEPIERGVSIEEIVSALKDKDMSFNQLKELADRLEREGVRKP